VNGDRLPQDKTVVKALDLTKRFGDFTAVDAVSFEVKQGEIVGYLGPNGSGKTTTIRMLLGLLQPTAGAAEVLGFDTVRQAESIRQQVGYMSQKFALYHDLTVRENLRFYAGVYGVKAAGRIEEVIKQVDLEKLTDKMVASLSTGWRQRVALAAAIVHRPRLLFLDEPTSGVDPKSRRSFWDLIYTVVAEGVTALVTTHYMDEAEYCGRVGIMRGGRLLAIDTPENLKKSARIGKAWEVTARPLLQAYAALESCPAVTRVGLTGDRLRAITHPKVGKKTLVEALIHAGIDRPHLETVEPTLEDVFLALATGS
jgi:ABC-2 type transport system ATP-binding protein